MPYGWLMGTLSASESCNGKDLLEQVMHGSLRNHWYIAAAILIKTFVYYRETSGRHSCRACRTKCESSHAITHERVARATLAPSDP